MRSVIDRVSPSLFVVAGLLAALLTATACPSTGEGEGEGEGESENAPS
jgi:hypothetical protein